jgi:hypothetical protein
VKLQRPILYLFVGLVAVMINLPVVHSWWQDNQIESDGVDVTAEVTDDRETDDAYFIAFTIPAEGEREEVEGSVQVEQGTYEEAVRTQEIEVRILPDDPTAYAVDGQITSRAGLFLALIADVFLVVMVLFVVRSGSRRRPTLVLRATEDLERCPPGAVIDRLDDERYVIHGEVVEIDDDEVVLDLGDRKVRVVLDGHRNPAGYDQPVKATGLMIA